MTIYKYQYVNELVREMTSNKALQTFYTLYLMSEKEEERQLKIRMADDKKNAKTSTKLAKSNKTSKEKTPDKSTLVTQLSAFYDPYHLSPKKDEKAWKAWNAYRTEQIDNFVEDISKLIHQEHSNLLLSAAVFPNAEEALTKKHQNWSRWLENNWIDAAAPMTLTSSVDVITNQTRRMETYGNKPILTGIFGPFNGNEASDILRQVWAASQAGAAGVILFEGSHLTDTTMTALKAGLFKTSKP